MTRMVIGTNKSATASAIVREKPTPMPLSMQYRKDANDKLLRPDTLFDFSGIKAITAFCFPYTYYRNSSLPSTVDLSSVESIEGENACYYMFYRSTSITTAKLDTIKKITGDCRYMFSNCSNLRVVNLENLECFSGSAQNIFDYCNIDTLDLGKLRTVAGSATYPMSSGCQYNYNLQSVKFYSLNSVKVSYAIEALFRGCRSMSELYFYALREDSFNVSSSAGKTALKQIISGVTGCTIYFPKNLDPDNGGTVIQELDTYPNFGGTNTVLSFSLPSTFILTGANSIEYERNPKYDTQTALAWRIKDISENDLADWTPYYTNGINDPIVGNTLYSDSACTTSVTTISSIA